MDNKIIIKKKKENNMTTQLKIAKSKLNRLKEEEKELMKGLRKVALVLNESGEFETSKNYPAYSDSDVEFVEKLLKK